MRQTRPITSIAMIVPDPHPFFWYEAREKGSRNKVKPAITRSKPGTIDF
jgi:hypothetical protein